MAHSLFEPAPFSFGERVWQRVKDLTIGPPAQRTPSRRGIPRTDPVLLRQADNLDARGRQQLLNAILSTRST